METNFVYSDSSLLHEMWLQVERTSCSSYRLANEKVAGDIVAIAECYYYFQPPKNSNFYRKRAQQPSPRVASTCKQDCYEVTQITV
jgi:hypothetical protein